LTYNRKSCVVNVIVTEKAVFEVTPTGLVLTEIIEGLTVADKVALYQL